MRNGGHIDHFLQGVAFLHPLFVLAACARMAHVNSLFHQLEGTRTASGAVFLKSGAVETFRHALFAFATQARGNRTFIQQLNGVAVVAHGGRVIFFGHGTARFVDLAMRLRIVRLATEFFRCADVGQEFRVRVSRCRRGWHFRLRDICRRRGWLYIVFRGQFVQEVEDGIHLRHHRLFGFRRGCLFRLFRRLAVRRGRCRLKGFRHGRRCRRGVFRHGLLNRLDRLLLGDCRLLFRRRRGRCRRGCRLGLRFFC